MQALMKELWASTDFELFLILLLQIQQICDGLFSEKKEKKVTV